MNMEGPPTPPEKKEQEPITDRQAIEAMKAGNFELVRAWYDQESAVADRVGHEGRLELTIRLATMQLEAGLVDYARDTVDSVVEATPTPEQDERIRRLIAKINS